MPVSHPAAAKAAAGQLRAGGAAVQPHGALPTLYVLVFPPEPALNPIQWLQRWNFIERARLERELWDAFENGKDIEAMLEQCRQKVETPGAETDGQGTRRGEGRGVEALRLEIWQTTLRRIRRIEALMAKQPKR